MSFSLEDSEISEINSKGDKLEITTELETRTFDLSSIKDLEISELDQEDSTGIFTTIGTIAGFAAGDFTGAIGGGFSGWVASKIFSKEKSIEISFYPTRVLMQDFTGVPALADLAAMREAVKKKILIQM